MRLQCMLQTSIHRLMTHMLLCAWLCWIAPVCAIPCVSTKECLSSLLYQSPILSHLCLCLPQQGSVDATLDEEAAMVLWPVREDPEYVI